MTAPSPAQTPEEVAAAIIRRWSGDTPVPGGAFLAEAIAIALYVERKAERRRIAAWLRRQPVDRGDALAVRLEAGYEPPRLSPAPEGER